jgi:hypothetical protein
MNSSFESCSKQICLFADSVPAVSFTLETWQKVEYSEICYIILNGIYPCRVTFEKNYSIEILHEV